MGEGNQTSPTLKKLPKEKQEGLEWIPLVNNKRDGKGGSAPNPPLLGEEDERINHTQTSLLRKENHGLFKSANSEKGEP